MKKLLLASMCVMAAMPAMAQRTQECALSPRQNLIVNARDAKEIQALIQRGLMFDEKVNCGGTLMQLAVRRGNAEVLEAILRQDQNRANNIDPLDAFPIAGAPKQLPLILFAAYYAPNKQIIELLMAAGANITVTDDLGRNILWYLNKNPVLRNTALQDDLNNQLLYGMAGGTATPNQMAQPQQQSQVQTPMAPTAPAPMVGPADNLIKE